MYFRDAPSEICDSLNETSCRSSTDIFLIITSSITVLNAIVTFRAISYSVLVFFIADVREIVTVYDEVISLIRARSDVSHGLIMLVTHAAHSVPLIQQRTHIAHPWAALIFPRRAVFWLWYAESERRKIPAPAVNSALFCIISSGRQSRMFCRRALSGRESGGDSWLKFCYHVASRLISLRLCILTCRLSIRVVTHRATLLFKRHIGCLFYPLPFESRPELKTNWSLRKCT